MATYTVSQVLSLSTTTLWFPRLGTGTVTITQCSAGCTFAGVTTGVVSTPDNVSKAVVISGTGTITLQFTATYGTQTEVWSGYTAAAFVQSNWGVCSDINLGTFTGLAIGSGGSGSNDPTTNGGGGGGGGCDNITGTAFDTLIPGSMLPIQLSGVTGGGSTGNNGADSTVVGLLGTLDGHGGSGGAVVPISAGGGGGFGNSGTRGGSGAGGGSAPPAGGGGGGAGGSTGNGGAGSGQVPGTGGTGSPAGGIGGSGGSVGFAGNPGTAPGGGGGGNGLNESLGGPPQGKSGLIQFQWLTSAPGVGGGIIGGGVGTVIGE